MKILSEISKKIDSFIKELELRWRKSDFIESLREKDFKGSDEEILKDYSWLMAPKGGTKVSEPKQEPDEDDLLFDDEEERDNSIKIER